ncbi:hypothetical protein AMTRI_Chr11g157080 [Amborella trichopoda]
MGCIDHISELFKGSTKRRKIKQMQTVEIRVRMDCEGCTKQVKSSVSSMKDVRSVEVNLRQQKLTVRGCVDPAKVLKKVKETGKRAEMWLYVPYNLSYDKKAPSGYVKSTMDNPAPPPPDQGTPCSLATTTLMPASLCNLMVEWGNGMVGGMVLVDVLKFHSQR